MALLKQFTPINRHLRFLISPIFLRSHYFRKKELRSVSLSMSGHSFFGIAGVNWWLCCGQRMIRGGLSVVVPFAVGRPPEFMVEGVKELAERETAVEYEV